MGNLKKGTAVEERVVFTGNQQDFEKFRTWFHNEMDEKVRNWITLAVQVSVTKVFQDIVAERTAKNTTTPMQTDLHKFSVKRITIVKETIKQYGAPVKTNQRLHHIVDTTEIHKFISGENNGDEDEWKTNLWPVPTVQVWSNLFFKNSDLLRRRRENRNYGLDYLQKFQRGTCFLELL